MTAFPSPEPHPIDQGHPPDWAVEWGEDRYGVFASFEVGGVVQRMRWIPPGRFWMGSPESEAGRYDDEGPRHLVELTEGFWLADTPCTQELWVAVMGEKKNPSRFQSPRRPVEQVSWEDCQRFCEELAKKESSLGGRFPTEAEWEYACRAGTETATWIGDLEIGKGRKASLLDAIAWFGHNSSGGSKDVVLKAPNPWGLYDMLGNVWEWCGDARRAYSAGSVTNPTGPKKGSLRVLRGGSWLSDARGVRAACRYWDPPGLRSGHLGFRLALGQGRGAQPGVGSGRPPGVGRARDEPEPPGAAPDGGRR